MELLRYGKSYKAKSRNEFYKIDNTEPAHKQVRVNFLHFGRGYERTSDFGVNLRWLDVAAAITAFSEMGHPEAIRLRNALDLAKAVEEAGWQPTNETASN
ncbi:hypothetical protein [Bradyrhizobium cajani]|uniref:Uncharacterized protein n=1 Tax=Bradyrhizobium cajani TaxID=1928661 RepID=A0A844TCR2_9BRAD|nr:hypothetical protein [Bradyrhizobium cajani]MCP3372516.1 hypothetical protein [Bradyrhizobium cajani]MVT76843.1 hypothetical protein [Bradyrhizobium cajani]